MRLGLNWIVGGVAALTLAACQTTAPAETSAFSDAGLAKLDARMAQFVADRDVYGMETLLVQGGEVVQRKQYGLRNVETKAPITDDTIYRIYSMSKPVTGVALMQLYEQGKFKLDDPVTKFVPEFEGLRVLSKDAAGAWTTGPVSRAPTMREVMTHTAGFAYGLFGDDPANTAFREQEIMRSPDLPTFINKVADVPLLFQPGQRWSYSAAVDVQGYIIEVISGQSFGAYLDANVFTPLGMDDTGFYVPAEDYDRFSQVFGYDPETGNLVPVPYPTVAYKKDTVGMEGGGGGLVATMDDYAAFSQMLLNGGELNGARILKEETIDLMTSNLLPDGMQMWSDGSFGDYSAEGLGFGLDFGIITDPAKREAAYGKGSYFWGGAAGTWFWVDPVNDLYFIGMIQRFPTGEPESVDFRGTSSKLVYEALGE